MTDFIRPPADTSTGKRVNAGLSNDGVNDIYTQVVHVGDKDNPDQHQSVDNKGAAYTRFADGSPVFDIFGRQTVSEVNLMGVYKFYERDYASKFMKTETGSATVTNDLVNRGMKLNNTTLNGDVSAYNSHRFYNYRPLNDMTLTWTSTSTVGKVGLTREIGWKSENDKIIMEERDGVLSFLIHDSLSNITTRIPQGSWSHDNLDGTGDSGVTTLPQKGNIWWISFQYLSMGIVEFGQYVSGVKVLCHRESHYAELDRPYMESASMALHMSQTNTAITGSDSTMHVYCVTVTNDGYDDFIHSQVSHSNQITVSSDVWVPVLSYRPSQLTAAGDPNRSRVLPRVISCLAGSEHIEIRTDVNATLTGDTWLESNGTVDFDAGATAITVTDDTRRFGRFVGAGRDSNMVVDGVFNASKSGVTRRYNHATSDVATISVRLMEGADTPTLAGVSLTLWSIE